MSKIGFNLLNIIVWNLILATLLALWKKEVMFKQQLAKLALSSGSFASFEHILVYPMIASNLSCLMESWENGILVYYGRSGKSLQVEKLCVPSRIFQRNVWK